MPVGAPLANCALPRPTTQQNSVAASELATIAQPPPQPAADGPGMLRPHSRMARITGSPRFAQAVACWQPKVRDKELEPNVSERCEPGWSAITWSGSTDTSWETHKETWIICQQAIRASQVCPGNTCMRWAMQSSGQAGKTMYDTLG